MYWNPNPKKPDSPWTVRVEKAPGLAWINKMSQKGDYLVPFSVTELSGYSPKITSLREFLLGLIVRCYLSQLVGRKSRIRVGPEIQLRI